MITHQQYIDAIIEQSILYPVLAEIIAEYTGGEADVNTKEGTLCWTDHNSGDTFCWSNKLHLDNWLLPVIKAMDSNNTDLLWYNSQKNESTIIFPPKIITFKSLAFTVKTLDTASYFFIKLLYGPTSKSCNINLDNIPTLLSPLVYNECIKFLESKKELINCSIDHGENCTDYFTIAYNQVLIPLLFLIIKNTNKKFQLMLNFEIDLLMYLQNQHTTKSFLQFYFGGKYNDKLFGIQNLFAPGTLKISTSDHLADSLSTSTAFIL